MATKAISPGAAMTESGGRTVVDLAVAAGITWLTGKIIEQFANSGVVFDNETVSLILWAGYTVIVATLKRKLWPTRTDAAGVGRTDVTAGGKVI